MSSLNYSNEYLFSEIYLREITQLETGDEGLRASLQTIREWRAYANADTLEEWLTSFVDPVLDTLGFGHALEDQHVIVLYPDVERKQPVSVCYVVLPTEDLDSTLKGRHYAEKIIRTLRAHNLTWGLLTNGKRWRIYHTEERKRIRQLSQQIRKQPVWREEDHPDLRTPEDSRRYVAQIRSEGWEGRRDFTTNSSRLDEQT